MFRTTVTTRLGALAATAVAAAAVAIPADATAGVTLLEPVPGSTVVGPAIRFRIAVNQPGCQTNGSKGVVATKVDANPNNVNSNGLGDYGLFSDGSPQVFEATAPYIGLSYGYGPYTVRAYLLCSDPEGRRRIDVWSEPVSFTLAAPPKPGSAPVEPDPPSAPGSGPGQTPAGPGSNDPVEPAPPAATQQGPGSQPTAPGTTAARRCVVPKLAGLTVPQGRARLKKAGCKLGVTTPRRAVRGAVIRSTTPKAGRRLRLGSKVDVVLAKAKRGRK